MKFFKNLITKEKFGNLGASVCGVYAFIILINFAISTLLFGLSDFTTVLNAAINVIFYILVCKDFLNGRDNFTFAYNGMLYLLICDYVIPLILNILEAFATFNIFLIFSVILGFILGFLYFIFMVLEVKKRENKYIKLMFIVGIIMTVVALFTLIINISGIIFEIEYVGGLSTHLFSGGNVFDNIFNVIVFILNLLEPIIMFGFSVIYLMYPLVLKKERI